MSVNSKNHEGIQWMLAYTPKSTSLWATSTNQRTYALLLSI